ncbi:HipA family kinase [Sphingomonas sp.]|uniref:HipA family kinase n=1 Tax=Sphingomonas sp. TaxID=28214 RepID=UPI0031CE2809
MALPLDTLDIVEIVRPIDSGMTHPFLCQLEDDQLYAVKGRQALPHGLVAEVVAGCLGQAMGLPIPPFVIGRMPGSLLRHHGETRAARAIGEGLVFASAWQEAVQPVTPATLDAQPAVLLAQLYIFDHWIGNGDRSLTEHGGNPNLFVRLENGQLVAIDHNLAFALDYDPGHELPLHAGRSAWSGLRNRDALCRRINERMTDAQALLPAILDSLPEEWLDGQGSMLDHIASMLDRRTDPSFWAELG